MSEIIIHVGKAAPTFPRKWDNADVDWIRFIWDVRLNGKGITSSQWILPAGWNQLDSQFNVSLVNPSGHRFDQVCQVYVSCPGVESGTYTITNRITAGTGIDQATLERSVIIEVAQL